MILLLIYTLLTWSLERDRSEPDGTSSDQAKIRKSLRALRSLR